VITGERGKVRSAAGYALEIAELAEQCERLGLRPDYLYVCSAGATHSGILVGTRALGLNWTVQAIAPIRWQYDVPASIAATATALAAEIGLDLPARADEVRHSEDYVGPDYGILTREARVAIDLVARTEGILL